jgi:hypothetical protein
MAGICFWPAVGDHQKGSWSSVPRESWQRLPCHAHGYRSVLLRRVPYPNLFDTLTPNANMESTNGMATPVIVPRAAASQVSSHSCRYNYSHQQRV